MSISQGLKKIHATLLGRSTSFPSFLFDLLPPRHPPLPQNLSSPLAHARPTPPSPLACSSVPASPCVCPCRGVLQLAFPTARMSSPPPKFLGRVLSFDPTPLALLLISFLLLWSCCGHRSSFFCFVLWFLFLFKNIVFETQFGM